MFLFYQMTARLSIPSCSQTISWARANLNRFSKLMPIAFEFYAIAGRDKEVRQFLKEYYQQYCRDLARLIQRGIERDEFRVVDAEATATTLAALYEGLALLFFVDPQAMQQALSLWPLRLQQIGRAHV